MVIFTLSFISFVAFRLFALAGAVIFSGQFGKVDQFVAVLGILTTAPAVYAHRGFTTSAPEISFSAPSADMAVEPSPLRAIRCSQQGRIMVASVYLGRKTVFPNLVRIWRATEFR